MLRRGNLVSAGSIEARGLQAMAAESIFASIV